MPVRKLHDFLRRETHAIRNDSTGLLLGSTVGFDAYHWYINVIQPSLPASHANAVSLALGSDWKIGTEEVVAEQLAMLAEAGIEPVFVFSGINSRAPSTEDAQASARVSAWDTQTLKSSQEALSLFDNAGGITATTMTLLMKHLQSCGIQCLRAPLTAESQLAWMSDSPQSFLHACYGSADLLLFPSVRRIVTSLASDRFTWIDRDALLEQLELSSEMFLDVCLLAGSPYCKTFPPLTDMSFEFRNAIDMVRGYGSAESAYAHYVSEGYKGLSAHQTLFDMAVSAVTTPHILMFGQQCVRMNTEQEEEGECSAQETTSDDCESTASPLLDESDVQSLFVDKCPSALFALIAHNAISPKVPSAVLSRVWSTRSPLCGGNFADMRTLLEQQRTRMALALQLFLNATLIDQSAVEVRIQHWFDSVRARDSRAPLTFTGTASTASSATSDVNTPPLAELARSIETEFLSLVHLAPTAHSPYTQSLQTAPLPATLSRATRDNLLTLLSLLQTGLHVHAAPFPRLPPPRRPLPAHQDPEEPARLLVARVSVLVSPTWSPVGSAPLASLPLDRDLSHFLSLCNAERSSLRDVCEMVLLKTVHEHQLTLSADAARTLSSELPFGPQSFSTICGSLVNEYLQGTPVDTLKSRFATLSNVEVLLNDALDFWALVYKRVALVAASSSEEVFPRALWDMWKASGDLVERIRNK